jgi:hypothetical protein
MIFPFKLEVNNMPEKPLSIWNAEAEIHIAFAAKCLGLTASKVGQINRVVFDIPEKDENGKDISANETGLQTKIRKSEKF